ncbi:helix-turn-helix transcriptional regulator [Candidatus Pacearchaeota archaeon]|nr:helix-turn-helix transcriptional regulator [Candidatus Pacearchaeota archaeon]
MKNLKRIRESRKVEKTMNKSDLSALSGVSVQNIAQYENGQADPSLSKAFKLAKALNVTLEELME